MQPPAIPWKKTKNTKFSHFRVALLPNQSEIRESPRAKSLLGPYLNIKKKKIFWTYWSEQVGAPKNRQTLKFYFSDFFYQNYYFLSSKSFFRVNATCSTRICKKNYNFS